MQSVPFVNRFGVHFDIVTEQFLSSDIEPAVPYWNAKIYKDGLMVHKTPQLHTEEEAHWEALQWARLQK